MTKLDSGFLAYMYLVPDYYKSKLWTSIDDFSNEEWCDIKDFEGLYKISNYGRVKSSKMYTILRPTLDKRKMLVVCLYKDGKYYQRSVSLLVARAFKSNPRKCSWVYFKDKDPTHCNVENIVWSKRRVNHAGVRHQMPNRGKRVSQHTLVGTYIRTYSSVAEAGRVLGLEDHSGISACARGKSSKAYGYIWKYVKEE